LTEDSDGGNEWISSPFSVDVISKAKITDDLKDNIIDTTTNRRFQTIFKGKSLSEFWCDVSRDYPSLGRSAVTALLPFGSANMCERTFCHGINQGQADKLPAAGPDLIFAVSIIPPRIDKLTSSRQAQVSH
jgi:hypothetical protein